MSGKTTFTGQRDTYECLSTLANDSYSTCYLVKRASDGKQLVARVSPYSNQFKAKAAMDVATTTQLIESRYTVKYVEHSSTKIDGQNVFVLVHEYANIGNLHSVMPSIAGKQENLKLYIRITKSLLRGLRDIHRAHLDVNPLNIFLSGDLSVTSSVNIMLGSLGVGKEPGDSLIHKASMKD